MPPKVKFTKDEIINAGFELVREGGTDALTARALGERLGSSAKPIFGYFTSMEELSHEVLSSALLLYNSYISEGMASGKYPPYKASGMAYIEFARRETELFKILFMCDRRGDPPAEDRESVRPMLDAIMKNVGISEDEAYLLHLEMWVYVHGIATMIATGYLNWEEAFISRSLSDVYQGLISKHRKDKNVLDQN